jgi:hypothetical protein
MNATQVRWSSNKLVILVLVGWDVNMFVQTSRLLVRQSFWASGVYTQGHAHCTRHCKWQSVRQIEVNNYQLFRIKTTTENWVRIQRYGIIVMGYNTVYFETSVVVFYMNTRWNHFCVSYFIWLVEHAYNSVLAYTYTYCTCILKMRIVKYLKRIIQPIK